MMNDWKEVIIGNHIDLISGYAFKSTDFLSEKAADSLPVIKIKNVANGDVNLNDVVYHVYNSKLEKYLLSKGDVLIAMTGNHPQSDTQVVGDVSKYRLGENSLLNQRVGKLIVKDDTNLDFIYYLFKNDDVRYYLANQSSGSANQANISKSDILGLLLEIPCFDEQEAIAEILCSLDDKIDLLHRNSITLEQLAEALFRQWFVVESDDSWKIFKFHELVKHVKPGTNFQPKRTNIGIPFLNVRNFDNGFLNFSDISFITEDEYKRVHNKWVPEAGDVLISRIGTLGQVAVITERDLPVAVHYNMINLKSKMTSYEFLYFLLKSQMFQEKFESIIRQSVQEYVAIEDVENIELKLPIGNYSFKSKEQTLSQLFNKIEANYTQIKNLEFLRDTLLPKLMSGSVIVKM
jgi:type I restriction enzyme S subunit